MVNKAVGVGGTASDTATMRAEQIASHSKAAYTSPTHRVSLLNLLFWTERRLRALDIESRMFPTVLSQKHFVLWGPLSRVLRHPPCCSIRIPAWPLRICKCRPMWCPDRTTYARHRPNLAQSGTHVWLTCIRRVPSDFGPLVATLGGCVFDRCRRLRPRLDQIWADSDRCCTEFDQPAPNIFPTSTRFGACCHSPGIDRGWSGSNLTRTRPDLARDRPHLAGDWPTLSRNQAHSTDIGPTRSNIGRSRPRLARCRMLRPRILQEQAGNGVEELEVSWGQPASAHCKGGCADGEGERHRLRPRSRASTAQRPLSLKGAEGWPPRTPSAAISGGARPKTGQRRPRPALLRLGACPRAASALHRERRHPWGSRSFCARSPNALQSGCSGSPRIITSRGSRQEQATERRAEIIKWKLQAGRRSRNAFDRPPS